MKIFEDSDLLNEQQVAFKIQSIRLPYPPFSLHTSESLGAFETSFQTDCKRSCQL